MEFEIISLSGMRRRLETHAVPLRNPRGRITALLGITRDITEQKRAEERALQAERLAAIGQTVAGLAHESRNAFQRSQACLEMLALELEDRPDELEVLLDRKRVKVFTIRPPKNRKDHTTLDANLKTRIDVSAGTVALFAVRLDDSALNIEESGGRKDLFPIFADMNDDGLLDMLAVGPTTVLAVNVGGGRFETLPESRSMTQR